MSTTTKRCRICEITKPITDFNTNPRMTGGYRNECRPCTARLFSEWYARTDTPERRQAKARATRDWVKRNPAKKRAYGIAREASKKGAHRVDRVFRLDIYDRDRYICWLCGERTDPESDDRGRWPTLDHVVALIDGGDHTVQNLRCAHLRCNCSRGSRRRHERDRLGLSAL